jgi:hypothetical protein
MTDITSAGQQGQSAPAPLERTDMNLIWLDM